MIAEENHPATTEYMVNELASQAGHKVVWLPVAHCELNPIEWLGNKSNAVNSTQFTLTEMEQLTHEAFQVVIPERWSLLIAHVQENH